MFRRTTIVTTLLAGAVALGNAATAHAVDLRGGTIQMVLQKQDTDGDFVDMSQTERAEFFNISNCLCPVQLAVEITLSGAGGTLDSQAVEVWVGANCDNTTDVALRDQQCVRVDVVPDINSLKTPTTIPIYAGDLMWPNSPTCDQSEVTRNIYLLIDDNGDLQYENVYQLTDELVVDTAPPPAPEPAEVVRGEQGALVTWTIPDANADDIRSYQILCARADGSWSDDDGFPRDDAEYLTPLMVCPEEFTSGTGTGTGAPPATPAGGFDGGIPDAGAPDATPVDPPDAGPPPSGIDVLDPTFVCSGEIGKTESEYRIDGLADGVEYRIFLVTIDPRLNPTVLDLGTVTPSSVTDFWEDYKDSGGSADGGYCFVATATFGDYDHPFVRVLRDFRDDVLATSAIGRRMIRFYYDNSPGLASVIAGNPLLRAIAWLLLVPVVLFAGIWVYTGLLGKLALAVAFVLWRRLRRTRTARRALTGDDGAAPDRRRARALAAATTAAALLAWSHIASAQPYWDEPGGPADQRARKAIEAPQSAWQFELKFGPYVPDIDSEFDLADGEQGPYERMFGNDKQVMTRLELDRFFLYPYGQLGIGVGFGFLTTKARAYEVDSMGNVLVDPDTGRPVRSAGDETTLRILPTYLHGVYRLTALDDEVGIPLIPYGKLGLGWYIWQITRPDGNTAFVNDDPMCTGDDCSTSDARGATLGWQATLGIAIRAERLDKKAARGLQGELGVEHAGFFAELSYAKVDGLTGGDKLRVGDFTWNVGINFEF